MIRVTGIRLTVDDDKDVIVSKVMKKLRLKDASELLKVRIFRESIDARKKDMIYFVYTVDVELRSGERVLARVKDKDVSLTPDLDYHGVASGGEILGSRPVVVGTGPAGLFAGLLLAQRGYRPLLLERGEDVDARSETVKRFWETGRLNPESNVQFGEGGAGTFSDGKLTTLIKDRRCRKVLQDLIGAGAPEEISYSHKPHIGTDILRRVVKGLRRLILEAGGEVRFQSKLTDIKVSGGRLRGIEVNGAENMDAGVLVLAVGHSARDTFEMLHQKGLAMSPKAFSLGVRIEHPQQLINSAQYKGFAGHGNLGAAEYKLSYHSPSGRSAYTFCMCPGGVVVAATSEEGCVVTNGMSEYARDAENANSAILVGINPGDFETAHPLAGIEFQRLWERKAFVLGGGNYKAPAQLVGDLLAGRASSRPGNVAPSYGRGIAYTDLKDCLPPYVYETLREALSDFDRKISGFATPGAVLTGVETRSSSPVRIERNSHCEAGIGGIYPAGEGAGYAGGIISAAVDGIRVAEAIISKFRPWGDHGGETGHD